MGKPVVEGYPNNRVLREPGALTQPSVTVARPILTG